MTVTRVHVVRPGDYLTDLAHRLRFDADRVWSHAANAGLRALRPDPNQLAPGDVLHIPPDAARPPLGVIAGATNRFVATVPRVKVSLVLRDGDDTLANEDFVVLGGPTRIEGQTGDDGSLSFEVPVGVREVQVRLPRRQRSYPVRVGDLDPITEPSGVRQRLEHLGYLGWALGAAARLPLSPPADEDPLDDAVRALQRAAGLAPTGVVDDATRAALLRLHGS